MESLIWQPEWDSGMSVGIPEVDEEHKRFIMLINGLNHAIVDHKNQPEIKKWVQLILNDTEQHFAHEEALFMQWNYPNADVHAIQHAQIKRAYQIIMASLADNNLEPEWLAAELNVKNMLVDHFMTEDMRYRDFHHMIH